jgi:hypothetical protein
MSASHPIAHRGLAGAFPGSAALAALALLAGCGGGGGGDRGPTGSFSISPTSLSASALTNEGPPTATANITLQISGTEDVYVSGSNSSVGINTVDVVANTATTGTLYVYFKQPGAVGPGTYSDTVTINLCFDEQCRRPLSGGPVTVRTTYTVTGAPRASLPVANASFTASTADNAGPSYTLPIQLEYPPSTGVYVRANGTTSGGIESVTAPSGATNSPQVSIVFRAPRTVGAGTYTDNVQISVCADSACTQPISGSPLMFSTTYTISTPPLATTSRRTLAHNVVDAEYSRALDALVMVATYPSNALYYLDLATGTEYSLPLPKAPTSLAIGPNGREAAVGHDALISYVADLAALSQAAPPAAVQLNVAAPVFDLALDGRGWVHVVPERDQWVNMRSVNVATNTDVAGNSSLLRAGSRIVLQPNTTFVYTADNDLSPSSVWKWDVAAGPAAYLYSVFGGTYPFCGNLWFTSDGITAVGACGTLFRASATQGQDMSYAGRLTLSAGLYGSKLVSFDQSANAAQAIGIETSSFECGPFGNASRCFTNVLVYESAFYNQVGTYAPGPVNVNGTDYPQRAAFVFYDSTGTKRYLISKLYGHPNPATEWYLSTF